MIARLAPKRHGARFGPSPDRPGCSFDLSEVLRVLSLPRVLLLAAPLLAVGCARTTYAALTGPSLPSSNPLLGITVTAKCAGDFIVMSSSKAYVVVRDDYGTFADYVNLPLQGAALSGNFDGFGKRTIHNDSDGTDLIVDVLYHPANYDGATQRVGQDCK